MAEEQQNTLEIEKQSGSKMKLIIIVVVILLAGGAGAFFFLSGDSTPPPAEGEEQTQSAPADSAAATPSAGGGAQIGSALYVAMPRPFVFNVPGAARDRTVQIKVQLLVRGEANEEAAKKHIPLIESTLLRAFASTNADELGTAIGKETVRTEALENVQSALKEVEGNKVVERVLFTGFVMQ